MFIDEVEITVKSGDGGAGVVHFRREKFVPRGGPDGGDGGRGGDVILRVNPHLNTLFSFRRKKIFVGDAGKRGAGKNQTGRSADPLYVEVPPGTIIYDAKTNAVLGDLTGNDQEFMICKGGRGGRGNVRFANSKNKAPRIAEKGEPGLEKDIRLELKLIADIGIVGVPNAGKSTFLSVVTNATPKIAAYPFTTLAPNLGVAELGEFQTLVLADIPGLIEGAHMGIGLGHDFLRHIQRTRVLIHVLDGTAVDPIADLAQINSELALFDPKLGEKPQIVAFNKIDLPEVAEHWEMVKEELENRGYEGMAISAVAQKNVRKLLFRAKALLDELPDEAPVVAEMPVYKVDADPNEFTIEDTEGGWVVIGAAIERAAAMTYWEYDQSARRFQRILETIGIDEALREAGVEAGDTVIIGNHALLWEE